MSKVTHATSENAQLLDLSKSFVIFNELAHLPPWLRPCSNSSFGINDVTNGPDFVPFVYGMTVSQQTVTPDHQHT